MASRIPRRDFLKLAAGAAGPAPESLPNFVILLADDLGYGDLGCYGSGVIRTPNLDRLALQGVRFTDCYAAAPVCSPSRAALLTGCIPDRLGVYNWIPANSPMHLGSGEVTFAQILKSRGYATCHVGKWHLNGKFNSTAQPQPSDQGFDHWFSTQNNAAPSHADPVNFVRNGQPAGPLKGNSSTLIVNEAVAWIKGVPAGRPFGLFVCLHAPHEPIAADAEFLAWYPEARKRGEALYYANVSQMDHEVGRLVRFLDEAGLGRNTLVFFTSDNGPETLNRYKEAWRSHGSPGPLRGMKLHLYEGGIRVPGILRWPGRAGPGTTISEPISGVDLLPTICDIVHASPPARRPLDGASILPALRGRRMARRTPLCWKYYNASGRPKAALRAGDWKILGIPDRASPRAAGSLFDPAQDMEYLKHTKLAAFELYNLREDPGEMRDLASQQPERRRSMEERLTALYSRIQAEGPVWA